MAEYRVFIEAPAVFFLTDSFLEDGKPADPRQFANRQVSKNTDP